MTPEGVETGRVSKIVPKSLLDVLALLLCPLFVNEKIVGAANNPHLTRSPTGSIYRPTF